MEFAVHASSSMSHVKDKVGDNTASLCRAVSCVHSVYKVDDVSARWRSFPVRLARRGAALAAFRCHTSNSLALFNPWTHADAHRQRRRVQVCNDRGKFPRKYLSSRAILPPPLTFLSPRLLHTARFKVIRTSCAPTYHGHGREHMSRRRGAQRPHDGHSP